MATIALNSSDLQYIGSSTESSNAVKASLATQIEIENANRTGPVIESTVYKVSKIVLSAEEKQQEEDEIAAFLSKVQAGGVKSIDQVNTTRTGATIH